MLFYRGYNVKDIIADFAMTGRYGFEETAYILLFGKLPDEKELAQFKDVLANYRELPVSFVRDFIMKAPSGDIMNSLARSVLALYSYDEKPDDTSVGNVLRQCIRLIPLSPYTLSYLPARQPAYRDKICPLPPPCLPAQWSFPAPPENVLLNAAPTGVEGSLLLNP